MRLRNRPSKQVVLYLSQYYTHCSLPVTASSKIVFILYSTALPPSTHSPTHPRLFPLPGKAPNLQHGPAVQHRLHALPEKATCLLLLRRRHVSGRQQEVNPGMIDQLVWKRKVDLTKRLQSQPELRGFLLFIKRHRSNSSNVAFLPGGLYII